MSSESSPQMLLEALDAPERVRDFLSRDAGLYTEFTRRIQALKPSFVATLARGSSDHAATYAAYLIPLLTGRVVASVPPSLVSIMKAPLNLKGQLCLSLSQSGGSPDLVSAVQAVRNSGALTLAIVNDTNSPLAKTAEIVLGQHAGVEKSLAATKTVLCTLAAVARVAAAWSGDRKLLGALSELPDRMRDAVAIGNGADDKLLAGVSHAYIISRGLGMTAANELALKLKETCGIHAEAFSSAEVRHGPREIVDREYLVIALAFAESGLEGVLETAEELHAQGARVLLVAPEVARAANFILPESGDNRLQPILALSLLYPWLARSSVALGRNPDHPKTLKSKVIKTI